MSSKKISRTGDEALSCRDECSLCGQALKTVPSRMSLPTLSSVIVFFLASASTYSFANASISHRSTDSMSSSSNVHADVRNFRSSDAGAGFGDAYRRTGPRRRCSRAGAGRMKYAWGDALLLGHQGFQQSDGNDSDCVGPDGQEYPTQVVERLVRSISAAERGSHRQGRAERASTVLTPQETRNLLLRFHGRPLIDDDIPGLLKEARRRKRTLGYEESVDDPDVDGEDQQSIADPAYLSDPVSRSDDPSLGPPYTTTSQQCNGGSKPPARLCQSKYNTTAPMFGVSLTSGMTVSIVQKFPDLLQQVVFEVCESKECDILRGECVQTYVPYLFLVIPLGPVTLTGQDYVLVESGCVCRPKHGVHTPQTLDAYFQPALPTPSTNSSSVKSLP